MEKMKKDLNHLQPRWWPEAPARRKALLPHPYPFFCHAFVITSLGLCQLKN